MTAVKKLSLLEALSLIESTQKKAGGSLTEEETQKHLVTYLGKNYSKTTFELRSFTDKGKPKINPFLNNAEGLWSIDWNASTLNYNNDALGYDYYVTVNSYALGLYLQGGRATYPEEGSRLTIDSEHFIQLMHDNKWGHARIIGSHGGKKAFLLNHTLPLYLKKYPEHAALNDNSFQDNHAIKSAFQGIRKEIQHGFPPQYYDLDDKSKALVNALIKYDWKNFMTLGLKKMVSKDEAHQAAESFVNTLNERIPSVRKTDLKLFGVLEKESGNGYSHYHFLTNSAIQDRMAPAISRAWSETTIDFNNENKRPCAMPTAGQEKWFKPVYSKVGVIMYILKEYISDPDHSETLHYAIQRSIDLKQKR